MNLAQHRDGKGCTRQQRRQAEQRYGMVHPFRPVSDPPQLRSHCPDEQRIGNQLFGLQQRQQEGGKEQPCQNGSLQTVGGTELCTGEPDHQREAKTYSADQHCNRSGFHRVQGWQ
ncbi:hypothetical protein D3C76_1392970 [compost metagenome]